MRCEYTNFLIKRRFGLPQGYKEGEPLQLVGTYGSIGILIRYLCSRMVTDEGVQEHVLNSLSRLGTMIGRPLKLTKSDGGQLEYDKEELKKLTDLAAPDAGNLDFNGGKLTFAQYVAKDKTWQAPEWDRFGQTEEQVKEQKERTIKKREAKRVIRVGKEDESYRIFYFGVPVTSGKSDTAPISRITLEDLIRSDFLSKAKDTRFIDTGEGLKIALSGGSTHNKTATKKFFGPAWKDEPPLKGEVVIVLTQRAPLVMDEYLSPDESWLNRFREEHLLTPFPANSAVKSDLDVLLSNAPPTKKSKKN